MGLNCFLYLKNGNILSTCPIRLVWGLNEITHGKSWEQLLVHGTYSVNNISWTIKIEFCQQSRSVNFKIGFKPISIMPNLFLFSFYFLTHFQPCSCPFSLSYVCHYVFLPHPPTTPACSCLSSHTEIMDFAHSFSSSQGKLPPVPPPLCPWNVMS